MTVTVLVLLGLTLWLTSFKKMRVTITKPADTDPPYIIRKGELLEVRGNVNDGSVINQQALEVEGVVDDAGNIYQQPEMVEIKWYSKDPKATGGEVVHWRAQVPVDQNTKRLRQRLWVNTIVHNDIVYITASRAWDRAKRSFGPDHRPLTSNIVRVRVE